MIIHIVNISLWKWDKYIGTALSDIKDNDMLIIMIKRKGKVIIPQGNTQIKKDDILVLNHRTVEE